MIIIVTNIKVYDENDLGKDIFNEDCKAIFFSKLMVDVYKEVINTSFNIKYNKKLTVNITYKQLNGDKKA